MQKPLFYGKKDRQTDWRMDRHVDTSIYSHNFVGRLGGINNDIACIIIVCQKEM